MNNIFDVKFANEQTMNVEFHQDGFSVDFGQGSPSGEYAGPYEVTPSDETQVLNTRNKLLDGDVIINPIPSNYGRLEWNGQRLLVY